MRIQSHFRLHQMGVGADDREDSQIRIHHYGNFMSSSSMYFVSSLLKRKAEIFLQSIYINLLFEFAPKHLLDGLHKRGVAEELLILLRIALSPPLEVVAVVNGIVERIVLSKGINFQYIKGFLEFQNRFVVSNVLINLS